MSHQASGKEPAILPGSPALALSVWSDETSDCPMLVPAASYQVKNPPMLFFVDKAPIHDV